MKTIYKLMIFLAIFQLMPLVLNSLNIFPYTFYGADEVGSTVGDAYIVNQDSYYMDAQSIFGTLFLPDANPYISGAANTLFSAILIALLGVGTAISIFTKNFVIIPLAFQGYMVAVMLSRSMSFFGKMFYSWDSKAVGYIALIIGVCIIILIVITWMETVTHGDV